jgi:hypothetical protein
MGLKPELYTKRDGRTDGMMDGWKDGWTEGGHDISSICLGHIHGGSKESDLHVFTHYGKVWFGFIVQTPIYFEV